MSNNLVLEYVKKNQTVFEGFRALASDDQITVYGFPSKTNKEIFNKILDDRDTYFFPVCIYLINFGAGVPADKEFVKRTFDELLSDESAYTELPSLAYIAAYCENRDGNVSKSQKILVELSKTEFSPALVTLGELAWMKNEPYKAKEYFKYGSLKGHFVARRHLLNLYHTRLAILKKVGFAIKIIGLSIFGKAHGKQYLYFNFYGMN